MRDFLGSCLLLVAGQPGAVEAWQRPWIPSSSSRRTRTPLPLMTTTTTTRREENRILALQQQDDADEAMPSSSSSASPPSSDTSRRRMFLALSSATMTTTILWGGGPDGTGSTLPPAAHAVFDGGIGGLGKTRPDTGVVPVNADMPPQQTANGVVSAELLADERRGDVALVSFRAPWPLLATSTGLEARDLSTSDAAFCQVVQGTSPVAANNNKISSGKDAAAASLQAILETSVLAPQGKFGMYGAPSGVRVKRVAGGGDDDDDDPQLFQLSFTTLTPGMRESDRRYYVAVRELETSDALFLLLVGSTAPRFAGQKELMRTVARSWRVTAAPPQRTSRRSSSSSS